MSGRIDRYEEICAVSANMAAAARSGDWDRLIELERRAAALRDEMIVDTDPARDASLSVAEVERKRDLIRRFLADEAEVRRHVEPWIDHVRHLLSGQGRRRQVQQAYAASDSGLDAGGGSPP